MRADQVDTYRGRPRSGGLAGQLALHPVIDQALLVAQRIAVALQPEVVQVAGVAEARIALVDDTAAGVLQRVLQADPRRVDVAHDPDVAATRACHGS
jgi:hypothetical protein